MNEKSPAQFSRPKLALGIDDQFALLASVSPNALIVVDEQGIIGQLNEYTEKLFGYQRESLLGQPLSILFRVEKALTHLNQVVSSLLKEGRTALEERSGLHGLKSDGTTFPIAITVDHLYTQSGHKTLCTVTDLSLRREAEQKILSYNQVLQEEVHARSEELDRMNRFLNSVIENIPDMIFVKDANELRFTQLNRAGEELLGIKREEMIGRLDSEIFPSQEAQHFIQNDRTTLNHRQLVDIPEETIHTKSMGVRVLHTKKIPILNAEGNPEYLLGISEDITERKMNEEIQKQLFQEKVARDEAEKGIRLRDDFIAVAAHELKTPLTALKLQFQIIPRLIRGIDFSEKDKFFQLITNSLRQLDQFGKLVDELLDVSRASSGRMNLMLKPVDLKSLIEEVIQSYTQELDSSGCELKLQLEPGIIGTWDMLRIGQVIVNLLSNAMKYGAGKPIELRAQKLDRIAMISVRDFGIGLAKADQQKIFERFERAAPVTKYRGLGLGLFITRHIVQAHHGTIRVDSEPDKGATFTVMLPLSP